ncbi:MAG: hypothetical protein HYW34_03395 [Candidatus Brennerbacteria bacterium]|nr:hypothetical protein [Candidatus Brennerbacteria bacterium]
MDKNREFLEELKKAFDYTGGLNWVSRIKREKAFNEVNKIKLELERQSKLNYKNLLDQIITNMNLAPGLQIWAVNELNRIDNDDVIHLRRQQIKKMKEIQNQVRDITVRDSISAIISDLSGRKNNLSDDYTVSCKDNTKADLN